MKQFKYSADGGAIQLGNENFTCNFMNDYGDGEFDVYIVEKGEMRPWDNFIFQGCVQGTFNVYGYDCDTDDVLITLSGRYGVFVSEGTVILEKWR